MQTNFNQSLKADLSIDDESQVRQIFHTSEYFSVDQNIMRNAAKEYFQKVADTYNLPKEQLENMHQKVSFFEPREQKIEFRQSEEKTFFDSTTIGYYQTIHNVPVWRTGLSVTIKQNPNRVIVSTNNSQKDVNLQLPNEQNIEKWKKILQQQLLPHYQKEFVETNAFKEKNNALSAVLTRHSTENSFDSYEIEKGQRPRFIRGRFYVYKYDEKKRQALEESDEKPFINKDDTGHDEPIIELPPIDSSIIDGKYYLVVEITFSYGHINWLMLVEVATDSILYIEPLSSGVNGLVYLKDPITKTGDTTKTPNQSNAVLNPYRDDVTLNNIDAPAGGIQNLRGSYAVIQDVTTPAIAPPTNAAGVDFDANVRTDYFAAVNAYYHVDRFFSLVADLGFPVSSYFPNTNFPVPVDHRGRVFAPGTTTHTGTGIDINAHCVGNGVDGIQHLCFLLEDTTDTANPMGIAADWRVHLHELGGHGILYEHVGTANFIFSHSAGDSFSIILNDPDSALRTTSDRFLLLPFVPAIVRRSDRDVASGWAWGGTNDVGGYSSEQILSTTHFRIYRSIGGDHSDLGRRQFAARVMAYLILRTISSFTPGTNPSNALAYCNAMMAIDQFNWMSEGLFGGAYKKVIRWAFEKQGLFQAPGAPTPISSAGQPPAIDVYIDDGRQGEYQFLQVHWENQSIWNQRNMADAPVHAEPTMGSTNFAYVKVKNRGTANADNVTVKAYHCLPGAGLTWPIDFTEMPSLGGSHPPVPANNAGEVVFGPFLWIPNTNAYGHDCILIVASHPQDTSNVDNFTAGETIEEWRLVPNDNNIGQRNVYPVPGGGGGMGLMEGLNEKIFFVRNSFRKTATIELKVQLPEVLAANGWAMNFKEAVNNQFVLKANEKKPVTIQLTPGKDFTKQQISGTTDRNIRVLIYANSMLLGGMTYYLDPDLKEPFNMPGSIPGNDCKEKAAGELLQCLNIGNDDQKIKKVCVKKVSLDIELDNDCNC